MMGYKTKAIRVKREPSCFKIGSFLAASGVTGLPFWPVLPGAFAGKGGKFRYWLNALFALSL
jgi:hypothetical protein